MQFSRDISQIKKNNRLIFKKEWKKIHQQGENRKSNTYQYQTKLNLRNIARDKEGHFIMIQKKYQENIKTTNVYITYKYAHLTKVQTT